MEEMDSILDSSMFAGNSGSLIVGLAPASRLEQETEIFFSRVDMRRHGNLVL